LAVQWLNEALCFVSSSVLADSLVLRNRQLLVAAKRYRKPYDDIANIKRTDMKRTFLNNMGQRTTLLAKANAEKKTKKMPPHEKILLPTHIAHICLCLLTHKPTQRQSQKSAISNALLHSQSPMKLPFMNPIFAN
jgi:hypothetical protein